MPDNVFIDMDNVLVDFPSGIQWARSLPTSFMDEQLYGDSWDDFPNIFSHMNPVEGAVAAFEELASDPRLNVFILSTAPWNNPSAWSDKLLWVKRWLGQAAHKRLILSHHKELHRGRWLIDDRTANGAGDFTGELVRFGAPGFETWPQVSSYIKAALDRTEHQTTEGTIRPCPFCGGHPRLYPQANGWLMITCVECNAYVKVWTKYEEQAWLSWNYRDRGPWQDIISELYKLRQNAQNNEELPRDDVLKVVNWAYGETLRWLP